jgi:uncharacterized protein
MKITFDPAKRDATLQARGLDFADARTVFSSRHTTRRDNRREYGEDRFITVGLKGNCLVVVWTSRGEERRVISMRDANAKEKPFFDRYGR